MPRHYTTARGALLLIDGLDEAGALRERIEQHITSVLAPQGHVLLCTSRPAGIYGALFADAGVRRLELGPLTDAQQLQALTQRLGAADAESLLEYVQDANCVNLYAK